MTIAFLSAVDICTSPSYSSSSGIPSLCIVRSIVDHPLRSSTSQSTAACGFLGVRWMDIPSEQRIHSKATPSSNDDNEGRRILFAFTCDVVVVGTRIPHAAIEQQLRRMLEQEKMTTTVMLTFPVMAMLAHSVINTGIGSTHSFIFCKTISLCTDFRIRKTESDLELRFKYSIRVLRD